MAWTKLLVRSVAMMVKEQDLEEIRDKVMKVFEASKQRFEVLAPSHFNFDSSEIDGDFFETYQDIVPDNKTAWD
ncbi:MAG: hypothetical protein ABSB89_10555 [Candidatus Bathyarchaeia archaeon]